MIKKATKVIIGAGGKSYDGWVSTDRKSLDIRVREDFEKYWEPSSIDAFLAEHVWEHLTEEDGKTALKNCYEFLRPGGYLRLAVPDGYHKDNDYIEQVKPGGKGIAAEFHKVLYNFKSLSNMLLSVGFKVDLLEYWDDNGEFNNKEWDVVDGFIYRSKNHDRRNKQSPLSYTSLIADAIK